MKFKSDQQKMVLLREIARMIYEEGIKDYGWAKEKVLKKLFNKGHHGGHAYLPSNKEIYDEINFLADMSEGQSRYGLLSEMRRRALFLMKLLKEYEPRLVGDVLTGKITRISDIQINLYTDTPEFIDDKLSQLDCPIERENVEVKGTEPRDRYTIYLNEKYAAVVNIFPSHEINSQVDFITRKALQKATIEKLEKIIQAAGE